MYYPTSDPNDRTASFELKSDVALYGGFEGDESQLSQRDWQQHRTILSGDIDRNDQHIDGVVIDTTGLVGANSYHVVKVEDVDANTILDGFMITAGWANGSGEEQHGGALYSSNSGPSITNVNFSGNAAMQGGAIYNYNSSPTMTNASFFGNAGTYGGAIYNYHSYLRITSASFSGNSATNGGAIFSYSGYLRITNTSFSGNSATNGGAIYDFNLMGGYTDPHVIITNTSFSGNSATNGGAIVFDSSTYIINNSILWGNSSSIKVLHLPQMGTFYTREIRHSLIEGCEPGGRRSIDCGHNHGGNLAYADPLFINPISHTSAPTTTGDLRLQSNSPAINKGENAQYPNASNATDLAGKPRIIGSSIDLGAYEAGYWLTKHIVGSGQFTHTPNQYQYLPDTKLTVSIAAHPGWSFAGWSGDLSGSSSPTTLLIDDTKSITATFTNDSPTANAGADQSVVIGSTVKLDGSASFDADPTQTLTYAWTQTAGPSVTLTGANTAKPTFTAPSVAGTLTFSLIVTDSTGQISVADSVTFTVVQYRVHLPMLMR